MRKLMIREDQHGQYNLSGFGRQFAGADGREKFELVIESKSRHLLLEFPQTSALDLFTKVDFKNNEFQNNALYVPKIIEVKSEEREIVVVAGNGTFYDFLKERGASGRCVIRSSLPVAFYWAGNIDDAAA